MYTQHCRHMKYDNDAALNRKLKEPGRLEYTKYAYPTMIVARCADLC